jgi:hypothetical protein
MLNREFSTLPCEGFTLLAEARSASNVPAANTAGMLWASTKRKPVQFARRFALLVCFGMLFALAGCKSKLESLGVGPMIPVEGKVTVGGKPLRGGMVYFNAPEGETRAYQPTGFIDTEGNYSVSTSGEKGAPAGKYRVTVDPASDDKLMDLSVDAQYMTPTKTPFLFEVKENAPAGAYDLKMEIKKR